MKIVVSIPAYNEEKTIGSVITNIKKVMQSFKYDFLIQVVDDGSKDHTVQEAEAAGAEVYSHPINYGLAETFRTETKQALKNNADVIVHIDADGQYLARDIPKLIKGIEKGSDLVLGNRFKGKIESMPIIKRIGNKAFSRVISHICRKKIGDAQTGFRAFTKEVANLNIISNHTYTQEQIIRAVNEKFIVTEIPAYFARRNGKSRLLRNPFEYALKAWINIFRIYRDYEPLKFFGFIGLLFFVPGVAFGIWLLYLFSKFGFIGKTPTVLLVVLLIGIAIQIWVLGFLADMMRK
ncbi:MAG: glycosyltransferase family 2 protein [Candidatus Woesearchaeota archaeon]|jgi:glycosyltransferase involved in cell wall biosynthesis|nr:glycosyltransferase family 2 protein [Candidatus Woesearchaeota archaeon]MDP7323906.1 glycosyltransferase family 2 protein [Candidatus Woesearchaeota archaeon]MDP7457744.1 glycosyltransferase family 2 protein [Candidatus Woesearchaeota archaeon]